MPVDRRVGRNAPPFLSTLLIVSALVLELSCSSTITLTWYRVASPHAVAVPFSEIRNYGRLVKSCTVGECEVRVHYAAGEEAAATRMLSLGSACPRMLEERTGLSFAPMGVDIYLYPAPSEPDRFACEFQSEGSWPVVLLVPRQGRLLDLKYNQDAFVWNLPHELTHLLLWHLPLRDNWLSEGIPEYLAAEFARQVSPQALDQESLPGAVALARTPLVPWSGSLAPKLRPYRKRDPERAAYITFEVGERYPAARELVTRWMTAAEKAGTADPLRDLLLRIRQSRTKIDFNQEDLLARQQTGKSLEQLKAIGAQKVAALRIEGGRLVASGSYLARIRGLLLLETFGAPRGFDTTTLLSLSTVHRRAEEEDTEVADSLLWQLGRTMAALARDEDIRKLAMVCESREADTPGWGLPALFWLRYAALDRSLALRQLASLIMAPQGAVPLRERLQANDSLEWLTGATVQWRLDLPPRRREAIAAEWRTVISSSN